MFTRLTCAGVALIASISIAKADDCDPEIFKSNNISIHEDWVKLLYAQTITQTQQSSDSSGLSIAIPGYGSLNGNAANSYINQLVNSLNLNLQKDEKSYLFASDFTSNGVQAYINCLQSTKINVYLRPSTNSEGDNDLTVFVGLRPYPTGEKIPIIVNVVTGGTIKKAPDAGWYVDKSGTELKGHLNQGSTIGVSINRDVTKRFELRATAGETFTEPETMALPPVPSQHLIQETRYSTVFPSGCDQCNYPKPGSGVLSMALPADETVVPRSEYIVYCDDGGSTPSETSPDGASVNKSDAGLAFAKLNQQAYSSLYRPHNVDIRVNVGGSPNPFSWHGNWMLKVNVWVPVPVGQSSSNRQDSPGRLVNAPHMNFCTR
jgi:hypothetical protein